MKKKINWSTKRSVPLGCVLYQLILNSPFFKQHQIIKSVTDSNDSKLQWRSFAVVRFALDGQKRSGKDRKGKLVPFKFNQKLLGVNTSEPSSLTEVKGRAFSDCSMRHFFFKNFRNEFPTFYYCVERSLQHQSFSCLPQNYLVSHNFASVVGSND